MAPFGDYLTVLAYGQRDDDDDDETTGALLLCMCCWGLSACSMASFACFVRCCTGKRAPVSLDESSLVPARPELKVIDPAPGQEVSATKSASLCSLVQCERDPF